MAFPKKKTRFVGLYLTADRIEAAVVGGDPHAPEIETQYLAELPPDIVDADGNILDVAALGAELKRFWKDAGLKSRKVVLALDSRKALLRQIRLPKMPINSLDQAILSEAEQFALFRDDEPLIDYFVNELEHEFIQATYGVVTKELVTTYTKALKLAGLSLKAMDLVQLAGQRGMEYYHPLTSEHWTGVMVQPQRLIVSFWMDGRLDVMREIILPERMSHDMAMLAQSYLPNISHSVASDTNFFDDQHMVLACDRLEDARALAEHAQGLLSGRVSVAGPDLKAAEPKAPERPSWDTVDEALDATFDEPASGGFGGGYGDALDAAFDSALGDGITATIPPEASPEPETDEDEDEDAEDDDFDEEAIRISYITLGAALWGHAGVVPSLNLLPHSKAAAKALPKLDLKLKIKLHPLFLAGLAASLLLGTVLSGWQLWQKGEREAQVKTLMRQLADAQVQMQGNQQMIQTQPPEAEMLRQWMPRYQENLFARRFLNSLQETTPSDAWISTVTYLAGDSFLISGGALSQTSCLHFADQIATLDRVRQVRLIKMEKDGRQYLFEARAELGSKASNEVQP